MSGGAPFVGRRLNVRELGSKTKWSENPVCEPSAFSPPNTNTRPDGDVQAECRIRRTGSLPQFRCSSSHLGLILENTSSRAAESARSTITVGEFGPGRPPKSRTSELLKAESVCHAKAGPWELELLLEPLTSSQGGDCAEKDEVRDR